MPMQVIFCKITSQKLKVLRGIWFTIIVQVFKCCSDICYATIVVLFELYELYDWAHVPKLFGTL